MEHSLAQQQKQPDAAQAPSTAPAAPLAEAFAVGDWVVHPDLNRLHSRRGDSERQLEPRLIHLLCYLAANPQRVLSREELVSELWPRVVVNENSLTRAISELRKHLAGPAQSKRRYIDTIPKKGYRLIPAVAALSEPVMTGSAEALNAGVPAGVLAGPGGQWRSATIALCFSLAFGLWLGLDSAAWLQQSAAIEPLLADEVLRGEGGFFGGEITLSTGAGKTLASQQLEAPVISNDETQYAYIQYDSAGSTIFLGRLNALAAPVVSVYNSPDKLFNLTWSPLGHSLIFARQPQMATAALYSDTRQSAELMSLDLSTLEVHRLLQDTAPADSNKPQNLT